MEYFAKKIYETEARLTAMDITDAKLIAELRRNARTSLSDLAQTVGLSRVTVRNRLARLQEAGTIVGYTVVLADDIEDQPIRGLMMLGIEGRGTDRITRILRGLAEVRAIHSTNGKWDLIVELGTETLPEFDSVLSRIRKLDGVSTSETSLLLKTQMPGRR